MQGSYVLLFENLITYVFVFTIVLFVNIFSILGPSSGGCWVSDTDAATMATGSMPSQGDIAAIAMLI